MKFFLPDISLDEWPAADRDAWLREANKLFFGRVESYEETVRVIKKAPYGALGLVSSRDPLIVAVEHHYPRMVRAFLAAGAPIKIYEDKDNAFARCMSFWGDNKSVLPYIKLLIEAGFPVDARRRGSSGDTPLQKALTCNDLDLIRYLTKKGADPFKKDDAGNSVMDNAAKWNRYASFVVMEKQLLKTNPPSADDYDRWFQKAVVGKAAEVVEQFLARNIPVSQATIELAPTPEVAAILSHRALETDTARGASSRHRPRF